jgi:hypothetical protein
VAGLPAFAIGAYARAHRRPLAARLVAVLDHAMSGRGYCLLPLPSRAIRAGDIHEIVATADPRAAPGATVDEVAIVGFAEFTRGGILVVGDHVRLAGRELGRIVGFDEMHLPNHLNILIRADPCETGVALGAVVEDRIEFAAFA